MVVFMIWEWEILEMYSKGSGILTRHRSMEKCGRLMTVHEGVVLNEELDFHQIQAHTFISHKSFQEENEI